MKKIIFLSALLIAIASPVLATECPFGVTNDPAPGQCRLYTDKNGNDYCDYSETAKAPVSNSSEQSNGNIVRSGQEEEGSSLLPMTILFFILQAVLILFVKLKKLGLSTLKKINNWLLLASFLVVAVSSAPFLLRDAGLSSISGLREWSELHTVSGWLMILFSIEHVIRRWWCFKVCVIKSK